MNCKQGDLAVIVRSTCGNVGRIVTCIELIQMARFHQPDGSVICGPAWIVEPPLVGWRGDRVPCVRDERLRPLRDSDGPDEMVQLVGLPAGTRQVA